MKHKALKTLGRYKIVREIGRGAMGVVYEGTDPIIGRRVAIKAARRDLLEGEERTGEMMQRFLREARAAGLLNHPGIVTIYDAEEDKDVAFIAMEYMAGGSLKDRLRDRGRLEPKEAVRIGMAICNALAAAHENGVVHRDIKPANILIHTDGAIKVGDFGIARISDSTLTQDGAIVGTPYCMSPEQVVGQKVDGRSDLFSVGVILYEMLTGQRPFAGDVFATVLHKIVNEEAVPPNELAPGLSECLSRVVMKSLSKAPEDRYQDGRTMAAALRESLKAEPDPAVLGLDGSADAQPRAPQHDMSTVLSVRLPGQGQGQDASENVYLESSGAISSFTPRLSRLMKRKTLLPAILTTMLFLVVGVIAAIFVLGKQNVTLPASEGATPTPLPAQSTPQPAQPIRASGMSAKPDESTKKPEQHKNTTAKTEASESSQAKNGGAKHDTPKQTAKSEPAEPTTEAKPPKEKESSPEIVKQTEPPPPEDKVTPSNSAKQTEPPPPEDKVTPSDTAKQTEPPPPEEKVTPPDTGKQTEPPPPEGKVTPPDTAKQTKPPPPEEKVTPPDAAKQTELPPPPPDEGPVSTPTPVNQQVLVSQDVLAALKELPSVAQLTVNLWFADSQEAWVAANNTQLKQGERYALCQTTGTATVTVSDAMAPQQPPIASDTIISGGSIWITTQCPQIRVTYTRDGYWPTERTYSADSPGQAVADEVVLKSRNLP